MRVAMLVVFASAVLGSCIGEARTRSVDGTLVLELGGENGSLRRALLAAGIVIDPRPIELAPIRPMADVLGGAPPGPQPQPQPELESESERPSYREVELQPNETISHLAQRHLGTMRRYREILILNGWTEAESRRLPAGTVVKIPLQ